MFKNAPESLRLTLRALARLVGYPDAELRAQMPDLIDAQAAVGVRQQAREHAQRDGEIGHADCHDQTSALIGMVRRLVPPNRLVSLAPSEQPLPNEKPQPPRTSKVFSAYSRCVLGITKRSS